MDAFDEDTYMELPTSFTIPIPWVAVRCNGIGQSIKTASKGLPHTVVNNTWGGPAAMAAWDPRNAPYSVLGGRLCLSYHPCPTSRLSIYQNSNNDHTSPL